MILKYVYRSWRNTKIQEAYRERKKKKEGESYLIKERQRRMQYYKPSRELTRTQRIKRNKKNMHRNIAQVVSKEKRREDTTRSET